MGAEERRATLAPASASTSNLNPACRERFSVVRTGHLFPVLVLKQSRATTDCRCIRFPPRTWQNKGAPLPGLNVVEVSQLSALLSLPAEIAALRDCEPAPRQFLRGDRIEAMLAFFRCHQTARRAARAAQTILRWTSPATRQGRIVEVRFRPKGPWGTAGGTRAIQHNTIRNPFAPSRRCTTCRRSVCQRQFGALNREKTHVRQERPAHCAEATPQQRHPVTPMSSAATAGAADAATAAGDADAAADRLDRLRDRRYGRRRKPPPPLARRRWRAARRWRRAREQRALSALVQERHADGGVLRRKRIRRWQPRVQHGRLGDRLQEHRFGQQELCVRLHEHRFGEQEFGIRLQEHREQYRRQRLRLS